MTGIEPAIAAAALPAVTGTAAAVAPSTAAIMGTTAGMGSGLLGAELGALVPSIGAPLAEGVGGAGTAALFGAEPGLASGMIAGQSTPFMAGGAGGAFPTFGMGEGGTQALFGPQQTGPGAAPRGGLNKMMAMRMGAQGLDAIGKSQQRQQPNAQRPGQTAQAQNLQEVLQRLKQERAGGRTNWASLISPGG